MFDSLRILTTFYRQISHWYFQSASKMERYLNKIRMLFGTYHSWSSLLDIDLPVPKASGEHLIFKHLSISPIENSADNTHLPLYTIKLNIIANYVIVSTDANSVLISAEYKSETVAY